MTTRTFQDLDGPVVFGDEYKLSCNRYFVVHQDGNGAKLTLYAFSGKQLLDQWVHIKSTLESAADMFNFAGCLSDAYNDGLADGIEKGKERGRLEFGNWVKQQLGI